MIHYDFKLKKTFLSPWIIQNGSALWGLSDITKKNSLSKGIIFSNNLCLFFNKYKYISSIGAWNWNKRGLGCRATRFFLCVIYHGVYYRHGRNYLHDNIMQILYFSECGPGPRFKLNSLPADHDYSRFLSVLLSTKSLLWGRVFKHHDLQTFGVKLNKYV